MDNDKKIPCPKCHQSKAVIPIIYGMPDYSLFLKSEKGKVKLGGCCICDNNAQWHCKDCDCDYVGGE